MSPSWHWRSMRPADLARVVPLADALFPDHPEDFTRFAERLALGADLCLTLADDQTRIARGRRGSDLLEGEEQGEVRGLSEAVRHLAPPLSLPECGDVAGYAVAYPWPLGRIPPLNQPLGAPDGSRGALYLHDLAVLPGLSGRGHAGAGLALLVERARMRGANAIALVAVNGSAGFWRARGFTVADAESDMAEKLAGYGQGARYMVRAL